MTEPIFDWDDAYANSAHIAGSEALPDLWVANAAAYRAQARRLDIGIAYGDNPRETFDLIWPDDTPKGLLVFIHGGYWMMTDSSVWTDLAEGARANGWAVCLPNYTLAPDARISQMTRQVGAAINAAAKVIDGPILLSGHSAGGHLASRMICADTPLRVEVQDRVQHTMSISGLHDLRPLMLTKMNDTLQLIEAEAVAESPVLHRPVKDANLTCWVGGNERPEFIRQSQILAQIWTGLAATTQLKLDDDHNHFTVIEGLKDKDSAIVKTLLGLS